jgi:spoIIIJ-associated protein
MSESRREIEARGQDVEAAIESGLEMLDVDRSDVIVEVLDEGSKGLLGIGSRDAVVRLTMLAETSTPAAVREKELGPSSSQPIKDESELTSDTAEYDEKPAADDQNTAVTIVEELLAKMQIEASITVRQSEPDDLTGKRITMLDIQGNDLGALIGPRGETLNAFQHIARLMAAHQMKQRASFVIDVQEYRQRRELALARLAERMARKVADRQRAISLEPMPPNERRIIHVALRDNEMVFTRSAGEGNRRRVRIHPKNE